MSAEVATVIGAVLISIFLPLLYGVMKNGSQSVAPGSILFVIVANATGVGFLVSGLLGVLR
jgi:hypothetical protein